MITSKSTINKFFEAKYVILVCVFYCILLIPVILTAIQIKISLVDDVWCSLGAGLQGQKGIASFVFNQFFDNDSGRLRWIYDIEQHIRWAIVGDNLGIHHLIILIYRLLTAFFCMCCVHYLTNTKNMLVLLSPLAFALFHPIVPESRIGAQEPLFCMFLMLSIFLFFRFIQINKLEANNCSIKLRLLFIFSMIGLIGSKEPAIVPYCIIFAGFIITQYLFKRFYLFDNIILLTVMLVTASQIYFLVMGGYSGQQSGITKEINLGWYLWLLKETFLFILFLPNDLLWQRMISITIIIFGTFICVYKCFINIQLRSIQWLIYSIPLLLVFFLLIFFSKMQPCPRYFAPLVWIFALFFAIGVNGIIDYFKRSKIGIFFISLVLLLLPLANYTAFLHQFLAQKIQRDVENSVISYIEESKSNDPQSIFFIFGMSPDIKHAWDGFRHVENCVMLHDYLLKYRPTHKNLPSIKIYPIEEIEIEMVNHNNANVYLISAQSIGKIQNVFGDSMFKFISTKRFAIDNIDSNNLQILFKRMKDFMQYINFSANKEHKWSDAGSPKHVFYNNEVWEIHQIAITPKTAIDSNLKL